MDNNITAIENACVVTPSGTTAGRTVIVQHDKILQVAYPASALRCTPTCTVNARGLLLLPGLVDIHVHGAIGHSFNSNKREVWETVLKAHLRRGSTNVLATIATAPLADLIQALEVSKRLILDNQPGLLGVHLEGPYLNPEQRGAHDVRLLRLPMDQSWDAIDPFIEFVRLVTLAPELEGGLDLIDRLVKADVIVSVGHSDLDVKELMVARERGVHHSAHMWSGQSSLTKVGPWRRLGLSEAILSSDALTAELITDGFHVTPELARIAYRCLGPERICLVSDSSPGAGLPVASRFHMGAQEGVVVDGVALSADGLSFCGSTSFLIDILRFAVLQAGLPLHECVYMASTVPARILGLSDRLGLIAENMQADLIVADSELQIKGVMQSGVWVWKEL